MRSARKYRPLPAGKCGLLLCFLATCSALLGQSVDWARGSSPDQVLLTFVNCSPTAEPALPSVPGLAFTRLTPVSQFSNINGAVTQTFIIPYRLRADNPGPYTIPSFTVATDQGRLTVPDYRGNTTSAQPLDGLARSVLAAPRDTFWAGEVFPLSYTISTPARFWSQAQSDPEWSSSPLVVEEWLGPSTRPTSFNGQNWNSMIYSAQGYARTAGRFTLEPVRQLMAVGAGGAGAFGLFSRAPDQLTVASNRPELTIRPLPAGAPASFNGAVGSFTFESAIVPRSVTVGEPVTWTLVLKGAGNWPDIPGVPARRVSRDFQAVQPKARTEQEQGRLFEATLTEDVILVPTRAGSYTLGPVEYSYFNPADGTYHTIRTPETTVVVTDAPGTAPAAGTTPPPQAPVVREPAPVLKLPDPPATPPAIPREPLMARGVTSAPFQPRTFGYLLGASGVFLTLGWMVLAWRHAVLSDPLRPRRLAARRLAAVLSALKQRPAAGADRTRLLLEWQHASAGLWGVTHAAPPAGAVDDPAWTRLWEEADRAMYSSGGQLPADWPERAGAALAARRLKPLSPFQLLRARHLFPFMIALAALTGVPQVEAAAAPANPSADYRQGNFAAAEKQWRAAVKTNPLDWSSRHNLSLALAQQDRGAEAAAHAIVAFAQQPSNESVRWHLEPALAQGSIAPAEILPFAQKRWTHEIARRANPARWQQVLIAAAFLAAVGGLLMLAWISGRRNRAVAFPGRALLPAGIVLLLFAVVAGAAGITGLRAYGTLADPGAVLVWRPGTLRSIPTEADTAQKTTPLAPGTIAVVDREFLQGRWLHLRLSNQQTGWARADEVLPIWR